MSKLTKSNKEKNNSDTTLFTKFQGWSERNSIRLSILIPFIALIFSILMFDAKISIGHDDALYIMAGSKYAHDFLGYYYTDNAPLYVMFLAIPISILGVKLLFLKCFSIIFFVSSVYFTYRAFAGRVSYVVLLPAIIIFSINWYVLTFASLTYTESFYLMFQGVFLLILFRHIEFLELDKNDSLRIAYKHWILLGLILYILFFSRTVGLAAFIAVAVYFLLKNKVKYSIFTVVFFSGVWALFEVLKRLLWGTKVSQFSQTSILYLKDAYDPSKGTEDIYGFIERFFGNAVIYISGRFWEILGFREESTDFSAFLTILTVSFILIGLITAYKNKQNYILSSSLYFITLLGVTFVVLQMSWGQARLIMVFIPLILINIFYGLSKFFERQSTKGYQVFYFLIALVFVLVNLKITSAKISKNLPILKSNLIKGDKYEGYTEDYRNFLKLSEYCADSLPKGSLVVSRKAPMSFVYAKGMEFFPVYKANGPKNADSLLSFLKSQKVTHVIFANLRINPKVSGDFASTPIEGMPPIYLAYLDYDKKAIINSVHNFFSPLAQKYPEKFELIKVMGSDEEAILYKIKY